MQLTPEIQDSDGGVELEGLHQGLDASEAYAVFWRERTGARMLILFRLSQEVELLAHFSD